MTERSPRRGDVVILTATQPELDAVLQVRDEIATAAVQEFPILMLGETGVDKELIARELHERSGRTGLFVPVNCAAISADVAFTGAAAWCDGLFSRAHGGTLFLDEINKMPAPVQPKLLRALTLCAVQPVGRAQETRVDVRVIAAAHPELTGDVTIGRFRADLYARLSGWILQVPPLRKRREDILALAHGVLNRRPGARLTLSLSAAEALLLHDWPFNVRELEHAIETAAVRAEGDSIIRAHYLPPAIMGRSARRSLILVPAAAPRTEVPRAPEQPRQAAAGRSGKAE